MTPSALGKILSILAEDDIITWEEIGEVLPSLLEEVDFAE